MGVDASILGVPSFNNFKIVKTGLLLSPVFIGGGITQEVTENHNLGFAPAFLMFVDLGGSNNLMMPAMLNYGFTGGNVDVGMWVFGYATTTVVGVRFANAGTTGGDIGDYPIRYYLLQETST